VDPWLREPDTRKGAAPEPLRGILTARNLSAGAAYDIYRWDTVSAAFTYSDEYKKARFTATADKHIFVDDKSFQSDGATYYRVVKAD
jgi:hypothetical protein